MSRYLWVDELWNKAITLSVPAPGVEVSPERSMVTVSMSPSPDERPELPQDEQRNSLLNFPRGSTQRFSSSGSGSIDLPTLNADAIKDFIAKNFSFDKGGAREDMEAPLVKTFSINGTNINLTEEQMIALIRVMIARQYDGTMHIAGFQASDRNACVQWLDSFYEALKQNANPAVIGYQLVNLLPLTAVITAVMEAKPDYRPTAWEFSALGVAALAVIRNNHFYAAAIAGASKEKIQKIVQEIVTAHNTLLDELKLVIPGDDADAIKSREQLLRLLTMPSLGKKVDQETRAVVAFLVKMGEAFALVYSDAFKTLPGYLKPLLALLFALVQGVDTAFSVVTRIGGQQRGFLEFMQEIIPTLNTPDLAPIFSSIANFAPIPWTMAKIGPLMWLVVRARAAMATLELLGADSEQMRGAMFGYYAVAGFAGMFASEVFTRYTVDENLARHLPTERTFLYRDGTLLHRIGQASIGGMPLGAVAAVIAHLAGGLDIFESAAVGGPTALLSTALLLASDNYRRLYSYVFELRFPNAALRQLDRLHIADKSLLMTVGVGATAFGVARENEIAATLGLVLLFLSGTALVAERSRYAANALRFVFAQMLLYSAAFLTWVINFVLPMKNMSHGQQPNDHPSYLDSDYFTLAGKIALSLGAALLGGGAAFADWKSTGGKVSELTQVIAPEEKRAFSISNAIRALGICCSRDDQPIITAESLATQHQEYGTRNQQ